MSSRESHQYLDNVHCWSTLSQTTFRLPASLLYLYMYLWKIMDNASLHPSCIADFASAEYCYTFLFPGFNERQDATRIKMQQGSRCNKDQDTTRIKIQRGSRFNEDQDSRRIKIQRGSSYIFSTFLSFSTFLNFLMNDGCTTQNFPTRGSVWPFSHVFKSIPGDVFLDWQWQC